MKYVAKVRSKVVPIGGGIGNNVYNVLYSEEGSTEKKIFNTYESKVVASYVCELINTGKIIPQPITIQSKDKLILIVQVNSVDYGPDFFIHVCEHFVDYKSKKLFDDSVTFLIIPSKKSDTIEIHELNTDKMSPEEVTNLINEANKIKDEYLEAFRNR